MAVEGNVSLLRDSYLWAVNAGDRIQPPQITFTDVTAESGVDFVHVHGGYGRKLLPETMGSGVLVFDFDQDGRQDLLLVNSTRWPHHAYTDPAPRTRLALYRNDGTGRWKGHGQIGAHARILTALAGEENGDFAGLRWADGSRCTLR